jgi:hypothetical protein
MSEFNYSLEVKDSTYSPILQRARRRFSVDWDYVDGGKAFMRILPLLLSVLTMKLGTVGVGKGE